MELKWVRKNKVERPHSCSALLVTHWISPYIVQFGDYKKGGKNVIQIEMI